jgi:Succinylglutamate desuccinylase
VRIHDVGDGEPSHAVVACLHGDEPCGLRAVDSVRSYRAALDGPVRVVVANERALTADSRSVDEDLNRAFPGDPAADSHESRLAADLLDALDGLTVLDLHSTVSSPEPFAVVAHPTDRSLALAAATGTDNVVDASHLGGELLSHVDGVAVECGHQGSTAAADVAVRVTARFLSAAGLLATPDDLSGATHVPTGETDHGPPARETLPAVFRIVEPAGEPDDVFVAENFLRVAAGEPFARRDGEPVTATESFYPVLMSTDGYADKLGYRATRVGRLGDV